MAAEEEWGLEVNKDEVLHCEVGSDKKPSIISCAVL